MGYCVIKNKMCDWTTADGYCIFTACKVYNEVIPSNGTIYVPFSKLKEYMADEQPAAEDVLFKWLKNWLKNKTIGELCELLKDGEKENGR